MSVMRMLVHPETVDTKDGIHKATHEAYCYSITPFLNPPIKVSTYKGFIDSSGRFHPITDSQTVTEITLDEFRTLLRPTSQGKPTGDFRLSDIQGVLVYRRRSGGGAEQAPN
jgi:hypothetical protein